MVPPEAARPLDQVEAGQLGQLGQQPPPLGQPQQQPHRHRGQRGAPGRGRVVRSILLLALVIVAVAVDVVVVVTVLLPAVADVPPPEAEGGAAHVVKGDARHGRANHHQRHHHHLHAAAVVVVVVVVAVVAGVQVSVRCGGARERGQCYEAAAGWEVGCLVAVTQGGKT